MRKRTYITSKVSRRIVGRKRSFVSPACSRLEGQEIAVGIFSGSWRVEVETLVVGQIDGLRSTRTV